MCRHREAKREAIPSPKTAPNTYEVPGCQETDYPYERIFSHFFRFVCSESIVTWQHVLTSFP